MFASFSVCWAIVEIFPSGHMFLRGACCRTKSIKIMKSTRTLRKIRQTGGDVNGGEHSHLLLDVQVLQQYSRPTALLVATYNAASVTGQRQPSNHLVSRFFSIRPSPTQPSSTSTSTSTTNSYPCWRFLEENMPVKKTLRLRTAIRNIARASAAAVATVLKSMLKSMLIDARITVSTQYSSFFCYSIL